MLRILSRTASPGAFAMIALLLVGASLSAVEQLEAPRVRTVELPLFTQIPENTTETIDLAFEEPISLDGVSFIFVDSLLLTHVLPRSPEDPVSLSINLRLLSEGRDAANLASVSDTLLAGGAGGEWPTVFRPSAVVDRRLVVDGLRLVLRSSIGDAARLESLHPNGRLRVHFVAGALDAGPHTEIRLADIQPEITPSLSAANSTDSPWQDFTFAEPVPMRDVRLVTLSGFSLTGDGIFGSAHTVVEILLDDGTVLTLDDSHAPSTGSVRQRVLSFENSLLVSDSERERFASEDTQALGWRWKIQMTGGSVALTGSQLRLRFLRGFEDCDGNAVPDNEERGTLADCNANGVLDACEPDCNGNGVPDDCDLAAGDAIDCNGNGAPDACDVAPTAPRWSGGEATSFEAEPEDLLTADFDEDGDLDVAVLAGSEIALFRNDGDGALHAGAGSPLAAELDMELLRVADFEDQLPILAAGGASRVALFRQAGGPGLNLEAWRTIELDVELDSFFLEDLDADGSPELIVLPESATSIEIWRGEGDGAFSGESISVSTLDGRRLRGLVVADMSGDDFPDLVAFDSSDDELIVFENDGAGLFGEPVFHPIEGLTAQNRLYPVRLDDDAVTDLVVLVTASRSPGLRRFLKRGESLEEIEPILADGRPLDAARADLDGDGEADWVFSAPLTNSLELAFADGRRGHLAAGIRPDQVKTLDLDGVSPPEILVLDPLAEKLRVFGGGGLELASADCDENGVPDECQEGLVCPEPPQGPRFIRGDCNADGVVTGSPTDAIFLLEWLFNGGPEPGCIAACDANGSGGSAPDLSDAIYVLAFNFNGGPAPVAPFPECGPLPEDEQPLCETPAESCNAF